VAAIERNDTAPEKAARKEKGPRAGGRPVGAALGVEDSA
jgi:hypothetical protein